MKLLQRSATILLYGIIVLASAEATLRLQQKLGPIYDLEMASRLDESLDSYSDTLNHRPAGRAVDVFETTDASGKSHSYRYVIEYDADGIRLPRPGPPSPRCRNRKSILFFGDSFIQGYDERNTVPYHVASEFEARTGLCVAAYNAGYSSYAPSIFIVQANRLIPLLRPDYVVVDIDETDLFDEYVRYRSLIVRDEQGRTVAVRGTPAYSDYVSGLEEIRSRAFYAVRFIEKLYFTRVHMPGLLADFRAKDPLTYSVDTSPEAVDRYRIELAYFESRVEELAITLLYYLPPQRVFFIHHPHLQHIRKDTSGRTWHRLVAAVVARVAERHGLNFFDATDPMAQQFGATAESLYWPEDMHFNMEGTRAYAMTVAAHMATLPNWGR